MEIKNQFLPGRKNQELPFYCKDVKIHIFFQVSLPWLQLWGRTPLRDGAAENLQKQPKTLLTKQPKTTPLHQAQVSHSDWGIKLALCFWRALRSELTTSVPCTPRTLKCFVQARRAPWKVKDQWPQSSSLSMQTRHKVCGEARYLSSHINIWAKISHSRRSHPQVGACQYQHNWMLQ